MDDWPPGLKACSRRSPSSSTDEAWQGIAQDTGVADGDLVLFGAGDWLITSTFMGQLLVRIGHDRGLADDSLAALVGDRLSDV